MKKFIIDADMLDIFSELDDNEVGEIVMVIGRYCVDGAFILGDSMSDRAVRIAANVIKKKIDKAEEISKRCSENGKRGMSSRYGGRSDV